jgi:hypothetical protein
MMQRAATKPERALCGEKERCKLRSSGSGAVEWFGEES